MNKWITVSLIIILIVSVVLFFALRKKENFSLDELAEKLTRDGWVMFSRDTCGFCVKQKNLFGSSVEKLNIINCGKEKCPVNGVPHWRRNNSTDPNDNMSGLQSLDTLRNKVL